MLKTETRTIQNFRTETHSRSVFTEAVLSLQLQMEKFKIILLTVAVCVQVTSQESTGDSPTQIPKPNITRSPTHKVLYRTEVVTLHCEVPGGASEFQYDWYNDSTNLGTDHQFNITVKDGGIYKCKAKNGTSESEKSDGYTLTLQAIPTPTLTKPMWTDVYTTENVSLKCEIQGSTKNWTYRWFNKMIKLQESKSQLDIQSAKKDDSGNYTCQGFLQGRVETTMSNSVTIKVQDLPEARVQSEWTEAFPGEKVSLQCVIPGSENWIYKWFKGSENVSSDERRSINNNTLTLSVKSGHEGEYACQAELKDRTVTTAKSKTHSLTVHGSKPTVVLKQDPSYQEIYTGEQVKLTCNIKENTSKWQYLWQKHSVQVNNHTYTIPSATLDQNGEYNCTITRKEMTYTESTKLNISEPPRPKLSIESEWKTFYPTETVTLKCSVDVGPDEWSYEWFRDRAQLSVDNNISFYRDTLSISSAKTSHSGQYTCSGKHQKRTPVTTGQAEPLQLQIYDNTPKPDITKHPWFEFFYTGEEVQLGCNMSGDGWKYDWYNGSKSLITNPNFTISSASLSDTGNYHCKAKRGDFSEYSDTLLVQVKEPPQPKLSIESEWKTFYPTEKVTLKCSVDGGPDEWSYEWFRNGALISVDRDVSLSRDTLSISSAKVSHSGQYTCRGKHLTRTPVTTRQAEALKLHIYDETPKPEISTHKSFEFFYTEEEVQLGCHMPGDGWEFHWYKDSKSLIAKPNHTISSASLSDADVYHCIAKRGNFSVDRKTLQLKVEVRPPALLSLETELSDIMSGNILTLRCNVSDGRQWNYTWFENGQKLNVSSHMFKVTATEETIKSEFKCKGIRTERPLYSALSEGFTANNIILKRKILLAISGCLVCCIIILIIGCLVLRFTRKPGKKEKRGQEDLFFSMADSKNQTASPLEEYMDSSPIEMEECEGKEELLTDHVSAVDEDDVIKDEDSPAAEANGLTSFKGL